MNILINVILAIFCAVMLFVNLVFTVQFGRWFREPAEVRMYRVWPGTHIFAATLTMNAFAIWQLVSRVTA